MVTFQLLAAARTNKQVDRLMNYRDRIFYAMQYFMTASMLLLNRLELWRCGGISIPTVAR